MAKGVTEYDVHGAADAILAGGERPTVERIRAHLGTGSPNTVTRWLKTWWRAAGARLAAQQTRLSLPEAPTEVVAVASQLWELALQRAGADAQARLADERAALATAHDALAQRESAAQMHLQTAFEETAQAREALHTVETRLADLQRLLDQQSAQLQDLQRERAESQSRLGELTSELTRMRAQAETAAIAAACERDTLLQQLRGSEDRAAAEIDRARQDAQRLKAEAKTRERQRHTELAAARQTSDALGRELQAARRESDVQRARADALEQQLARLADLPATVEAALSRAHTAKVARSSVGNRPARRSQS